MQISNFFPSNDVKPIKASIYNDLNPMKFSEDIDFATNEIKRIDKYTYGLKTKN